MSRARAGRMVAAATKPAAVNVRKSLKGLSSVWSRRRKDEPTRAFTHGSHLRVVGCCSWRLTRQHTRADRAGTFHLVRFQLAGSSCRPRGCAYAYASHVMVL